MALPEKELAQATRFIQIKNWVALENWQDRHFPYMREETRKHLLRVAKINGPARYRVIAHQLYLEPWLAFLWRVLIIVLVASVGALFISALMAFLGRI